MLNKEYLFFSVTGRKTIQSFSILVIISFLSSFCFLPSAHAYQATVLSDAELDAMHAGGFEFDINAAYAFRSAVISQINIAVMQAVNAGSNITINAANKALVANQGNAAVTNQLNLNAVVAREGDLLNTVINNLNAAQVSNIFTPEEKAVVDHLLSKASDAGVPAGVPSEEGVKVEALSFGSSDNGQPVAAVPLLETSALDPAPLSPGVDNATSQTVDIFAAPTTTAFSIAATASLSDSAQAPMTQIVETIAAPLSSENLTGFGDFIEEPLTQVVEAISAPLTTLATAAAKTFDVTADNTITQVMETVSAASISNTALMPMAASASIAEETVMVSSVVEPVSGDAPAVVSAAVNVPAQTLMASAAVESVPVESASLISAPISVQAETTVVPSVVEPVSNSVPPSLSTDVSAPAQATVAPAAPVTAVPLASEPMNAVSSSVSSSNPSETSSFDLPKASGVINSVIAKASAASAQTNIAAVVAMAGSVEKATINNTNMANVENQGNAALTAQTNIAIIIGQNNITDAIVNNLNIAQTVNTIVSNAGGAIVNSVSLSGILMNFSVNNVIANNEAKASQVNITIIKSISGQVKNNSIKGSNLSNIINKW